MLDKLEKEVKNVFETYEVKVTSEDILKRAAPKRKVKKSFNWMWGLMPAFGVSLLALVLLLPNGNNGSKATKVEQKIKDKAFVADVVTATDQFYEDKQTQFLEVEPALSFSIDGETIKEVYGNIDQMVVSSFEELKIDYVYKEEINVLNENQYNFVCEINDNYDNTIYFYYNLNEEQTHLDGVVFNHSYADYTIFSVKVEMDFKEVDGKVYTTSTYTEQFIGIDMNTYSIVENLDGSKTYNWYLGEDVIFTTTLLLNESELSVSYESLLGKFNFSINKETKEKYNGYVKYTLPLIEIELEGEFEVIYSENHQSFEINIK